MQRLDLRELKEKIRRKRQIIKKMGIFNKGCHDS
jgi:hypothetical protein